MKRLFTVLLFLSIFTSVRVYAQGCMEPTSSTGGVSVIGYIQPEFRMALNGKNVDGSSKNENSFYFRRARLGVTGIIPYDFSYYAMAEFSSFQNGPYLLDAFVTYNRFKPWFKISMGQFKKPFGLELGATGCQDLYTINRSRVINELTAPDRDLGVMISGSTGAKKFFGLEKENVFSYTISVTNGTGKNVKDNDQAKDFIGRLVIAPYDWISLGGSYHSGKQKNPDPTVTAMDERMRYGFDVTLKKYNFILQSEYVFGQDKGSKLVMPLAKYETYDSDMNKEDYDHTAFRQSTLTFGLNYYANDWVRLQLNYLYNIETSSSTDITNYNEIPNDMIQLQVQVKLN